MQKPPKQKKTEKNPDLSLNHSKSVRFRKRIQETKEQEQEVKEYLDGHSLQRLDGREEGETPSKF
jgi:hypothetical protein